MLTNSNLTVRSQTLVPALIALLGLVLVSAGGDILVANLPLRFGELSWRFRLLTSLLGAGPFIALVIATIAAVGLYGGQRLAVRLMSVLALLLAAVFVLAIPAFGLDFLQMRKQFTQDDIRRYTFAALKTAGIAALLIPGFAWAGWRGLQASKKGDEAVRRERGHGLVVGQEE